MFDFQVFLDMEWMCDHALHDRKCSRCGRKIYILSDVSKDDNDNEVKVKCDRCGETLKTIIEGKFEKVRFSDD